MREEAKGVYIRGPTLSVPGSMGLEAEGGGGGWRIIDETE